MPTRCNRGFYSRSYCLLNMFRGITMPIISSSKVLYHGCCLWYFVLWFSSCWSGAELRVMCPVCRMLQACAIACQNCAVHSVFPSGITSHSKIAQFNVPSTPRPSKQSLSFSYPHQNLVRIYLLRIRAIYI